MSNVLPDIFKDMQNEYGWATIPRTVVHDKASYMVTAPHDRLHATFAEGLQQAGLTSWVGDNSSCTKWLVKKFGDVYLHETVVSHIRRLMEDDFSCQRLGETATQFIKRVRKVEMHMNSEAFAHQNRGCGLSGLSAELQQRCQLVVRSKGERIPK